jgi:hypothetical protein
MIEAVGHIENAPLPPIRNGTRNERSAGERVPGTKPGLTLPTESKTHQRGASAVSLILLTALSASFVDTSDARRALCRRASILSRTMRV